MKIATSTSRAGMTIGAALLLQFLSAGCNENVGTSSESASSNRRDTNAAVANADNSRVNTRDSDNSTLTPGDQGSSAADRDITQKVRKMLVSSPDGYSVLAKNVKIITADGKVTLRGPVNTVAEKMGIVAIAKSVAGDGNVDDQLEVKANP